MIAGKRGILTMIAIALLAAAAANAPVMLAANDEAQWRRFVRSSVQRPAAPSARGPSRLLHLQGVVRRLDDDRTARSAAGPYGL
jgi:hypothetical protein